MIHPDLLAGRQTIEERRTFGIAIQELKRGQTEFAFRARPNVSSEKMRHELLAVADSQYGLAGLKDRRIDCGTGAVVDAAGTAGYDQALAPLQLRRGRLAGLHVGINTQLAHAPGD